MHSGWSRRFIRERRYFYLVVLWLSVFLTGCDGEPGSEVPERVGLVAPELLEFELSDYREAVQEASFTPYYVIGGQLSARPQLPKVSFSDQTSLQVVLSYRLYLDSVMLLEQGQIVVTLIPGPDGRLHSSMELSVPLPLHRLSSERLEMAWYLAGWQPLFGAPFSIVGKN